MHRLVLAVLWVLCINDVFASRVLPAEALVVAERTVQHSTHAAGREAVIVIDPGHGGKDPGAVGATETLEKDIALSTSKYLAQLINREYGMRALMTRHTDIHIGLRKRLGVAKRHKADLFISIHADAAASRHAAGASVYILSNKGASSEAARLLARRENKAVSVGEVNLKHTDQQVAHILMDLSQTAMLNHSRALASEIMRSLGKTAKTKHVESAGFVVLKSADIPSVLIELGYLSNPREEKKLRTKTYRKQLSEMIVKGIKTYFKKYATSGLLLAKVSIKDYIVKRGDTLSTIAWRFKSSVAGIKKMSKIKSDKIQIGQILKIPIRH